MSKILLFDFDKIEYLPLIRMLVERGFDLIMNATPVRQAVERAGLEVLRWEDYTPKSDYPAQNETIRVSQLLSSHIQSPLLQDVFESEFGNFLEATSEQFSQTLISLVFEEIRTIETLKALLSQEAVSLIVLACDNSHIERSVVLYARSKGIATLQLAHGIHASDFNHRVAADMYVLFSDYVAVFGKKSGKDMIDAGNESRRVFITGSVCWDALYQSRAGLDTVDARRSLGLKEKDPVILYCSSYADGVSASCPAHAQRLVELFGQVTHAVRAIHPQGQLLIRPHPNELLRATSSFEVQQQLDHSFYKWCQENEPGLSVRIIRDKRIESMRAADVVLTVGFSTVNYEAMILERPVVSLPWFTSENSSIREQNGITIVEDMSQLSSLLVNLVTDAEKREAKIARQNTALQEINHKNDGRATERVTRLICDLAEKTVGENKPPPVFGNTPQSKSKSVPLNILEIVHDFPPQAFSGTELYTLNLSLELMKLGHHVSVVYPVNDPSLSQYSFSERQYEGLKVFQFNTHNPGLTARSDFDNPCYDEPFRRFLKAHSFDIAHFQHVYGLSANWLTIAKEFGLAVFLKIDDMFWYCRQLHLVYRGETSCSGPDCLDKCFSCMCSSVDENDPEKVAQSYRYLAYRRVHLRNVFAQADFVHAPSRFLKDSSKQNGFDNAEFHIIRTGIQPFPVKEKSSARRGEKVKVGFVGEISQRKGIRDFLAAIEKYQTERAYKSLAVQLEFLIYGNHNQDGVYTEVLSKLRQLGSALYRGGFSQHERTKVFGEIDLLVMPSLGENYPFVLREALHARVPVVASRVGGVSEMVQDQVNGFLFDPGDVDRLVSILIRIAQNPELIEQMCSKCPKVKTIATEARELQQKFLEVSKGKKSESQTFDDLFERGRLLIDKGKTAAGLQLLSKVLDDNPNHKATIELIAEVYNRLGHKEEAMEMKRLAG